MITIAVKRKFKAKGLINLAEKEKKLYNEVVIIQKLPCLYAVNALRRVGTALRPCNNSSILNFDLSFLFLNFNFFILYFTMSGHSKWSKVKHQKAAKDPKRGAAFSKITSLITVAAREGDNIETNPKLRIAVDKAKQLGMPKENIERAIKRGAGETQKNKELEEIFCEAYGPGGCAILIQAITDNKNRTLAELRHLLQQYDAKMTESGNVRWMFKEKGKIIVPKKLWNDNISLEAIEKGAEDIKEEGDNIIIYSPLKNFTEIKILLEKIINKKDIETDFDFISQQLVPITDKEIKIKLENLFNLLTEHNDVEAIYSNIEYKI